MRLLATDIHTLVSQVHVRAGKSDIRPAEG